MEIMKATGKPTAITLCIGLAGDSNNVPPGECAVRLARAGSSLRVFPFISILLSYVRLSRRDDAADVAPFLIKLRTG